jgi:phosphoglucosamine mutase
MKRAYFGTDGIRGTANQWPMTAEVALRVGMAAGRFFRRGAHRHRVVIGKDTRLSGYMLEPALVAGFTAVGMDVILVGPLPTPAIAMLTKSLRADLGVMISASHNPFSDNGIKLFGPDGYKLSDEIEVEIESLIAANGAAEVGAAGTAAGATGNGGLVDPKQLGRAKRLDDAAGRYIEFAKNTFPGDLRLDGLKVVLDCANGAAYGVAPTVLWELEAEVVPIGVDPDGFNINRGCGSTDTAYMCEQVVSHGADIGIALDGDADRVLICDANGSLIDGDQLLATIARQMRVDGKLRGGGVVATVMSNLGLEKFLSSEGLDLKRTQVGDRYVVDAMRSGGYNLGGEQSGHIVLGDHGTTGDGLVAALQVLSALMRAAKPISEIAHAFDPYPQLLQNVRYSGTSPLQNDKVKAAIIEAEAQLQSSGRLVIRPSGTEPLIRVMAEADDDALMRKVVADLVSVITEVATS